MKIELFFAALKSIADLISGWFSREAKKKKGRKKAAHDTTRKQFWIFLLLLIAGCTRAPPVTLSFHPDDYQERKAGQTFVFPKEGFYMSEDVRKAYEAGVITEYYIRKRGFYVEDD